MNKDRKFINYPNLRRIIKKQHANPRLDTEDLPKNDSEEESQLLKDIRQLDYEISESTIAARNGG